MGLLFFMVGHEIGRVVSRRSRGTLRQEGNAGAVLFLEGAVMFLQEILFGGLIYETSVQRPGVQNRLGEFEAGVPRQGIGV